MMKEYINEKIIEIENTLKLMFSQKHDGIRDEFNEILYYPISAGGKRIRPILTILSCQLFDDDYKKAIIPAIALELIHTYSLIHDDLPTMDNDSMRRGLPTTHIKYGEANAILAGDGLLTQAFEILSTADIDNDILRKLLFELSYAAGTDGMVYGQYIDLYYEKKPMDFEMLKLLHSKKTAALIRCACRMGAIISKANEKDLASITEYGECIGLTFQIQDDILDYIADEKELGKSIGKDAKSDKLTYVKQFGLDGAKEQATIVTKKAILAIKKIETKNTDKINILIELAKYIIERGN